MMSTFRQLCTWNYVSLSSDPWGERKSSEILQSFFRGTLIPATLRHRRPTEVQLLRTVKIRIKSEQWKILDSRLKFRQQDELCVQNGPEARETNETELRSERNFRNPRVWQLKLLTGFQTWHFFDERCQDFTSSRHTRALAFSNEDFDSSTSTRRPESPITMGIRFDPTWKTIVLTWSSPWRILTTNRGDYSVSARVLSKISRPQSYDPTTLIARAAGDSVVVPR